MFLVLRRERTWYAELRRQRLEIRKPEVTIPERRELCGENVPEIFIWSPLESLYTDLHMHRQNIYVTGQEFPRKILEIYKQFPELNKGWQLLKIHLDRE